MNIGPALGTCRWLGVAALFAVAVPCPASGQNAAEAQLVAGAAAFRDEAYARALVAFKAAERLGANPEVHWYIAASLSKLEQHEQAVLAFRDAERRSPHSDDALLSYYFGVACANAELYVCATRKLASVNGRAGPQLADQARRAREAIDRTLRSAKGTTVEVYLARARRAQASRAFEWARSQLEEAEAISRRIGDKARLDTTLQLLRGLGDTREQGRQEG